MHQHEKEEFQSHSNHKKQFNLLCRPFFLDTPHRQEKKEHDEDEQEDIAGQ